MRVFSFDKGRSLETLTRAVGGSHYNIGDEDNTASGLSFAPMQLIQNTSDRAWALSWVEAVMELNGLKVTPQQRNEIETAIKNNAAEQSYSLSDLSNTLQDVEMREVLKAYTIDGSMGYLLDAEQDSLSFSRFTCFEIEELMNLPEKYALPIMLYLFRRIEKALTGDPAVLFLDEAWIMLGHPVFREKIREWLKVLRKKNCLVLLATQSLSDAANSGILDVLNESCPTKIYLPNAHAREEDASELYRRMGLNARQIEILATAIPKRQYYYTSPYGRRLFELALDPLTLAFVAVSDPDTLNAMRQTATNTGKTGRSAGCKTGESISITMSMWTNTEGNTDGTERHFSRQGKSRPRNDRKPLFERQETMELHHGRHGFVAPAVAMGGHDRPADWFGRGRGHDLPRQPVEIYPLYRRSEQIGRNRAPSPEPTSLRQPMSGLSAPCSAASSAMPVP